MTNVWPDLPFAPWSETCETLHRWAQIVGKVRLVSTPLVNHWWNIPLYVTARGLTTSPMWRERRTFAMTFDFLSHELQIETSDGARDGFALKPMAVADFYAETMGRLSRLGIDVHIWTLPNEIDTTLRLDEDRQHAAYDADHAQRFWRALVQVDRVFKLFRARFVGKVSPVHFFWGSFDHAVTRFSGRTAPPFPRGAPNCAAWVMQEAYSHEVSSCGFWPGNGGYGRAAFYSYAYPEPVGFGDTALRTPDAFYDRNLGEFVLPYDALRQAREPDTLLLGFLQETYEAAADRAGWDRKALERAD